jgi:iron(III) transport system substrate-binding protein
MKPAWIAAALALPGLLLGACGGDPDALVVYSAGPRPLAEAVAEAYTEQTGTPVRLFAATTGQIMAKLEAERYRLRADVAVFASQNAAEALRLQRRLLPYSSPAAATTRSEWNAPDGSYHGTGAAVVGIAVRSDHEGAHESWDDFFSGRFTGRMTLPSPSRSGAAADFIVGHTLARGEVAWNDYYLMRRNGLVFSAANSQAITSLQIGAYDAMLGAADYLIYHQISQGAPLRMIYPSDGAVVVPRPVAILRDTRRAEAARAFVDFYLSDQAQQLVAGQHLLPARADVELSPTRAGTPLRHAYLPPVDQAVDAQRTTLRRFQLDVERAQVLRQPEPARR